MTPAPRPRRFAGLFALEHSRFAYGVDFALYGAAVLLLAAFLLLPGPRQHALQSALLAGAGLAGWSLAEYLLHRFVLHGLQPFKGWHERHHQRPTARISSPTLLSATLIGGGVFLPAALLGGPARACALTLGVTAGYLAYAVTHHATHHWRARSLWLARRKRQHARHHHGEAGCYGVTSALWDHVFFSARAAPAAVRRGSAAPHRR